MEIDLRPIVGVPNLLPVTRAQRGDELPGQILVEQNFHAVWRSFRWASSASASCTDSSVRLG